MATAIKPPTAAQLKAISDRAIAATGKTPTKQAVLNTYAKWGGGSPAPTPAKPPSSATSKAAIAARSEAKYGKAPTAAQVNKTLANNVARETAKARATPVKAGPMAPGFTPLQDRRTLSFEGPGGPQDPAGANAYWADYLTRLKAGESPASIQEANAEQYGGKVFRGQGPEQNLSSEDYMEMILTQYEGSDNLGDIDITKGMSPAGKKAWAAFLAKKGGRYVGANSGQLNPEEWARNIEHAGVAAGLQGGRYGFGYDDNGRRLTPAELIAAVQAAG